MKPKSGRLAFHLIIALFFCMLSACGLFPTEEEVLAPPLIEPEEITYRTAEARIGYIEDSITRTAYFIPVIDKDHFFTNRSGRLKAIYVKLGDTVKAGDLIAELLTDDIEKEIEYQRILVDSYIKSCSYIEQKSAIEIMAAESNLADLEKKHREMLGNAGAHARNEIENIEREIKNQKISVDKLKLDYSNQLEMKKYELALSEMKLKQLEEELSQCRLYASVDGIVTYVLNISEGDIVDIYKTVATISDPEVLHLEYKGNSAGDFKVGMKVQVTVDKKTYSGEVVLTAASVPFEEMEKYRDTVQIKMEQMPEGVKMGDRAEIKLVRDFKENAVIIPKNALKSYLGKDVIYILEDGIRVERYVQKGVQSVSEVEITEGLKAGEQVIVE
ncbi:MAG: HlyD family efflux transporter periplasmic adaptor subunit [Clostridiaceae bacterium]|nr:HlyD family efflux transporter periplasmic adaptor subunit [Clostridiaceae bacterium]